MRSFQPDIEAIVGELINAFDLTFEGAESHLTDPIARWLDFRLRYIDPRPRAALKSNGFDSRLPADALRPLDRFVRLAESGVDLNPYQTKTIKTNDSSGLKRQLRTDGLWADWGIHHAHLTEAPLVPGSDFSARSEWLLFFIVTNDELGLIDVRSHNQRELFQDVSLIETAIRSWPHFFDRFAFKSAAGLQRQPQTDPESIKVLRRGGVIQPLEVDGKVYMPPGLGVTTASTSGRVSLARDKALQFSRNIENFFYRSGSEPQIEAKKKGVTDPIFAIRISQKGKPAVVCGEAALSWPFPSPPIPNDARSSLEDLLFPSWAIARLAPHL
jgi:hypothetical protein